MATLAQLAQAYLNQGLPSISGIFQPSPPTIGPILPVEPEPGITPLLMQQMGSGGGGGGSNNPYDLSTDFSQITSDRQKRLSQEPTGINKFLTDNLGMKNPQTAEDIVNLGYQKPSFAPGILGTLIGKVDKYGELPRADQAFIASRMGYTGPTVFGENNSGLSKDPFGLNTRSAFGNYAERVGVESEKALDNLNRLGTKYGAKWDDKLGTFVGKGAKKANQMTSMIQAKRKFYTGEDAAYKDYQNQVQNVLDADKEFSIEGDSSNYGIDGYPKYDIKDIQGEDDEDNKIDPTDPLKIDPISKKNAITNQIFKQTIENIKQREIEKQNAIDPPTNYYVPDGTPGGGAGQGIDISNAGNIRSSDNNFQGDSGPTTQQESDYGYGSDFGFARGGRVKFLNGGLADLVYLLGLK